MLSRRVPIFTQIAYIPTHAEGNVNHPDVELGFTASDRLRNGDYYCRYWSKHVPSILRTRANGERTSEDDLVEFESKPNFIRDIVQLIVMNGVT
jgi:hypothetical protein